MKITEHAQGRISRRTSMLDKDVLDIIKGEAFIQLGTSRDYEFLLFYSPPDRATKIAVVCESRTILVSVWDSDFHLPDGVKKVTREQSKKACVVLKRFLFSRLKRPEPCHSAARYPDLDCLSITARIEIQRGPTVEYVHEAGPVPPECSRDLESAWPHVRQFFEELWTAVESHCPDVRNKIMYSLRFCDSVTARQFRSFDLRHATLRRRLWPPE